jgi:hypothetical protein
MKPTGTQRGSPIRYVSALMCLAAALVTLPAGFIQMVRSLERGAYGTSSITVALAWLGVGGAFLGFGVALLIWELSIRHNIRH